MLKNKKRTEVIPTVLLLFLARCKGYSRLRRLACSATAAAQQYPPHTSRLKTVPRTVFLTPLTLSGFESLEKKRTEAIPTVSLPFLARCKGYSRLRRLACSATAAAQQYPPHTSRLKTVHRTVFLTPLTLSGFESLENKKNGINTCGIASVLGALQGIRTPDLLVRSLGRHFLPSFVFRYN